MLAPRAARLLICGPMFPAQGIGGLQSVLTDLADGLTDRGWLVDTHPIPFVADWRGADDWRSTIASVTRARVPDSWRFLARTLVHDLARLRQQSDVLEELEQRIADGGYSAVVACVDNAPVGLASVVTRCAPRHVLISLSALAAELRRARAIDVVRRFATRAGGRSLHRDLLRPVSTESVQTAVFASRTWRDAGVAAGLDPRAAAAIYFGVPVPRRLPPARAPQAPLRLLWAARLSTEKGLHLFLPAIAHVKRTLAVQLTVIDAGGPMAYHRSILRTIRRLGLEDVIRFEPAARREDLPGVLAAHDVFLFYSIYAEPVAQMLLLAAAAGTVVVAPRPRVPSIIRPGDTAMCFDDERPATIANAIVQAARDEAARHRIRARAFAIVSAEQSRDRTIADYDRLIAGIAGERRQVRA